MQIGKPNPNMIMPLEKMCITNKTNNKKIYVMYLSLIHISEPTRPY